MTILIGSILIGITFAASLKKPFWVFGAYIFLLYFYDFIRKILGVWGMSPATFSPFSLWEEAFLGGMVLALAYRWTTGKLEQPRTIRLYLFDIILVILAAWGLYEALRSPLPLAGIAAFRSYFQPIASFYLMRWLGQRENDLRRFLNAWLAIGVIVAALGIWQALAWTEADYRELGFFFDNSWGEEIFVPTVEFGESVVLRPVSTVTGPNELASHMLVFSVLAFQMFIMEKKAGRWLYLLLTGLFIGCLVLTYARTALLGSFLVFGIYLLALLLERDKNDSLLKFVRTPRNILLAVIVLVVVGIGIGLSGIYQLMIETVQTLPQQYHTIDTLEALEHLAKSPGGIGMGLVGPRQGIYYPEEKAAHVEGSVFQLALEMGVIGLLGWLFLVGKSMVYGWQGYRHGTEPASRALSMAAVGCWAGIMLVFLVLPLIHAPSLMNCLWLLAGTAMTTAKPKELFLFHI
jgi:hypothetical protein